MAATISIDTGGTFTDGWFTRDGTSVSAKVFTTPHDVTVGMFECVEAGAEALGVPVEQLVEETEAFRFSSTIVTNAILQGTGAVVGLVASPGDHAALVGGGFLRGDLLAEVDDPHDAAAVAAAVEQLIDNGAHVLAVSLDGSWLDAGGERAVRDVVRKLYPTHYLGGVRVFLASDISVVPGYEARTNTVVLNACVHDLLARSMHAAENRLRDLGLRRPFLLVQSHGGVSRTAKTPAMHTYSSGPVAGALGSLSAARSAGKVALAFDVGGTSADVALIDAANLVPSWTTTLDGLPLHLPLVPVASFAIGGGTIAHLDGDALALGPRSAGAHPGPACFDRGGTEPTVTDANLVLGYLDPGQFHRGAMALRTDRAETALATLGFDTAEAARRVRAAADDLMAAGVRQVLDANGVDPADAVLVAYGGGGGMHAAAVAERVGIPEVVVPWAAAVFSAVGVSAMDVRHLYPVLLRPDDGEDRSASLLAAARRDMAAEGFDWDSAAVELEVVDAAVPGSSLWREAWSPGCWDKAVAAAGAAEIPLAVLTVTSSVARHEASAPAGAADGDTSSTCSVDWGSGPEETVRRVLGAAPPVDLSTAGPAVLTTPDTTVAVPAGWRLRKDGPSLRLEDTTHAT